MPGLIIDKVGKGSTFFNNPKNYIHLNFADLKQLIIDGGLEPQRKYQLTDYLHQYFIAGSNSDGNVFYFTTYDYIYGYATFGYYVYDLPVGTDVIVTALPAGYTGPVQVGDQTKVSGNSQNWYFHFANGMHSIVGVEFKIFKQRFTTIEEGIEYLDNNGKPVMVPGGLINTQVHDGSAYMDMTAAENLTVIPEQFIFTAETASSFVKDVESFTFPGDIIEFDFNNTEIYNDNSELIGTRTGFIRRRRNDALGIDLPIDWRNARWRRWQLDLDSRTKLLNQHLDVNNTKLGSQGKWLYTAGLRRVDQAQYFYIGLSIEGDLVNLNEHAQKTTFKYGVESVISAKDYPIIPLVESRDPDFQKVGSIKAEALHNTVFQCLPGESNSRTSIDAGRLTNCTFVAQASIGDTECELWEVTAIDAARIYGHDIRMEYCVTLSYLQLSKTNQVHFKGVVFATMQNGVRLAGVDQPLPVVWWLYIYANNSTFINCAFSGVTPHLYLDNTKLLEASVFGYYSPTHPGVANDSEYMREVFKIQGGVLSKVTLRFLNVVDRCVIDNILFKDHNANRTNGLWLFDITAPVYSRSIKKNDATDALYYETIDTDYTRAFIELSAQAPNPLNDLATNLAVDNEAPQYGTNVVFSISGSNNGNKPATEVQVTSLLPSGFTYVSDNGAGSYNSATGIWTIGNIAAGASNVLNITATVLETGSYVVEATITGAEVEDLPGDNTDSITLAPVPAA